MDGAVVIDLTALDTIECIDSLDEIAVVGPGVLTGDLDRAAREQGLFYAPDPASAAISTIGGNVATNAGGMRCVKYGVTADSILGLDVVLADGRLLSTGRRTLKGVTGYDLTSLFVGSEGTLGVVVGATVRLRPVPADIATASAVFPGVEEAAQACADLVGRRLTPSLLELLDARTLATIDRAQGTDLSQRGGALLIAQADGYDAHEQIARIATVLQQRASTVRVARDAEESESLLAARRLALPSIEAFGTALIEDICVPRSRLAAAVRGVERIASDTGVEIHTFAHAGDGNLHPIISYDRDLAAPPDPAHEAAGRIFALAHELGGTISGEHGVGSVKRSWAAAEIGETGLDVHRALKRAFDPWGLLNPGTAF